MLATGIYPPDIGGPATMVGALANSLQANSFKVKVITYADSGGKAMKEGVDIIRIKRSNIKFFSFIEYFFSIIKLSFWADIIYATDTYSVGYFAYLIKLLTRKKYIIRFAGDSAWETAVNQDLTKDYIVDFQSKKYGDYIEKLKLRRTKILINADQVIAVSNFLSNVARQIGVDKNKITIIYNSIDFISEHIDRQKVDEIKSKYGKNAKILITACRLTPWKGVEGVIKSLPTLIEKVGLVNFLVLGDGEELKNLQQIAATEKMENHVHFLGRVDHDDTLNYMAAADLFILNSNYEGLSHVLLEAIKMGAPIVASRVGGNPEVIDDGQNGLLFGYNNASEILATGSKILSNENYAKELAGNAKEKLKIFNWPENVRLTVKLINKICDEGIADQSAV